MTVVPSSTAAQATSLRRLRPSPRGFGIAEGVQLTDPDASTSSRTDDAASPNSLWVRLISHGMSSAAGASMLRASSTVFAVDSMSSLYCSNSARRVNVHQVRDATESFVNPFCPSDSVETGQVAKLASIDRHDAIALVDGPSRQGS